MKSRYVYEVQTEFLVFFSRITLVKRTFCHCFNNKHVVGKST